MTTLLALVGTFLVCIAVATYGSYRAGDPIRHLGLPALIVVALPFAFPLFIFAWGLALEWHGPRDTQPTWRLEATRWLFFLLYPSLCAFSVWRSRGCRLFATSLIPLSLFVSLLATGVAVAAVTGD